MTVDSAHTRPTHATSLGEIAALRDAWNRAVENGPRDPSHTFEWIGALEETHYDPAEIHVLVWPRTGGVRGAWPLFARKGRFCKLPVRKLGLITNAYCNHNDLVVEPGAEDEMARTLPLLERYLGSWDVLEIEDALADSPRLGALARACGELGYPLLRRHVSRSPYLPLRGDFDELFLTIRSGEGRRRLRRLEKALRELEGYSFRVYRRPEEVSEALGAVFRIEKRSWKAREDSDITSHENQVAFYTRLAERAARQGWLSIAVLSSKAGPMAYEYNLVFQGRCFHLKGSFDESCRELSPAKVLRKEVLRRCCEEQMGEYDYTGQEQEHKREWTDWTRDHETWVILNRTGYGRLLSTLGPLGRW